MPDLFRLILFIFILAGAQFRAHGHEEPTSFLDVRWDSSALTITLIASTLDVAHDLPEVEPSMLLNEETLIKHQEAIAKNLISRMHLTVDGQTLPIAFESVAPLVDRRDLQLVFVAHPPSSMNTINISCKLFPYDSRHRSYLNFYQGSSLVSQKVVEGDVASASVNWLEKQRVASVVEEFLYQGIHHIFIGPDHILFVIGLLLLGGSVRRLLAIITAFTLAHSITLALATFRIISPPASVIEPVIALSIVVVGIHALMGEKRKDPRMIFAFVFGLIHGFGFASVLQEMELPTHALGWSLFSFNAGVEFGQAMIVIMVAPLLLLLKSRRPQTFIVASNMAAVALTTAGAFWFFQRVI